ncbi:hypothetical protein EJ08DRAFT_654667 [Tothia fuscella]|uniref:Uncharacterized protein n=1 Tax=Tothia fuscella TaxID=1048955 RepID=A0A9P4NEF5_9PEZI|nr:hypothetical protein EJ08DRAFT_654667 [Tothia fuscella]
MDNIPSLIAATSDSTLTSSDSTLTSSDSTLTPAPSDTTLKIDATAQPYRDIDTCWSGYEGPPRTRDPATLVGLHVISSTFINDKGYAYGLKIRVSEETLPITFQTHQAEGQYNPRMDNVLRTALLDARPWRPVKIEDARQATREIKFNDRPPSPDGEIRHEKFDVVGIALENMAEFGFIWGYRAQGQYTDIHVVEKRGEDDYGKAKYMRGQKRKYDLETVEWGFDS